MSAFVRFLGRRLLFALLLVFVISSGSLLLAHLAPGDYTSQLRRPGVSAETVARERRRLGLDRPVSAQYIAWLGRLVRFDLGTSFRYARPVTDLVGERAANTALLAVAALLLATGSACLWGWSLAAAEGCCRRRSGVCRWSRCPCRRC